MGKRKTFTAEVVSNKMQKTVVVKTMHLTKHSKYSRTMKQYSKFKAHNENAEVKIGDTVRIEETKPISKDKHFRVVAIVKKVAIPHVELKEETT